MENEKFLRQNNLENDEDLSKLLFIDLSKKFLTRDVLKKHVKIQTSEISSELVCY